MQDLEIKKLIEQGSIDSIKSLIDAGLDINHQLYYGETLLIYAAKYGRYKLAQFLVESGANINALSDDGCSALIKCSCFAPELKRFLIQNGAQYDFQGTPQTAIGKAAFDGDLELIEYYLSHGIDLETANKYQSTALTEAASANRLDCVQYLVEKGAQINHLNHREESALFIAVSFNYQQIVKFLLQHGADGSLLNCDAMNCVQLAASKCHDELLKDLLSLNQDLDLGAKAKYGYTALMLGVTNSFHWKTDQQCLLTTQVLLTAGAQLDPIDDLGNTALHLAAVSGFDSAVQCLIDNGADLYLKNQKSQRPLDAAMSRGLLGYGLQERQIVRPKDIASDQLYNSIKLLLEYETKPIHYRRLAKLKNMAKKYRCPEVLELL